MTQQPWQPQQYDPAAHQQRLGGEQRDQANAYRQQQYPAPNYGQPPQQWPSQPPYQPQPPYPPQPPRQKRHAVRNVLAGIGGLVVIIVIISVAANAGHSVKTSGGTGPSGSGQKAASASTAKIGTAITLTGNTNGEQMAVTVTKVVKDATADNQFQSLPSADRYYAVQFRLADTGSAAYSDSPSNGAEVVDSSGQSYQASPTDTVNGCTTFPGDENIATGSSGLGCIVFEVPRKAVITKVQFTLDSGMGPQTGQWDVSQRQ